MSSDNRSLLQKFEIPEEYRIKSDILEEIPNEDLLKMKEFFVLDLPKKLVPYTVMHSQYIRKKKEPDFPVVVCAPKGNPSLGIICFWYLVPGYIEVGVYSVSSDTSELTDALIKTKRVNWTSKVAVLFTCVDQDVVPCIKLALDKFEISWHENHTVLAYMEKEKAKNLYKQVRNDEDLKMTTIGVEHADTLNDVWPHRHDKSLNYFQMMLERGAAKGILDDEGVLRGWGLVSVRGDLHSLQTREAWRRKGYGKLIVASLAKDLAENDREVFGCVVTENQPSMKMFRGLGFELLHTTSWILMNMHEMIPHRNVHAEH